MSDLESIGFKVTTFFDEVEGDVSVLLVSFYDYFFLGLAVTVSRDVFYSV